MNLRSSALAALFRPAARRIFPDHRFHVLAWFALVPLLFALRGQTVKERLLARRHRRPCFLLRHGPLGHELGPLLRERSACPGLPHHASALRLSGLYPGIVRAAVAHLASTPVTAVRCRSRPLDSAGTRPDLCLQRFSLGSARLLPVLVPADHPDCRHHRRLRGVVSARTR